MAVKLNFVPKYNFITEKRKGLQIALMGLANLE